MKITKLSTRLLLTLMLILSQQGLFAQRDLPVFGKQNLMNGFEKDISGEILNYYSSSAYFAKDALLTRCTDGKKTISWETESLPQVLDKDYYYFYWLSGHSSGTSFGVSSFQLSINGVNYLKITIQQNQKPPLVWSFSGKDSVKVVFSATKTDVHKDLFGDMYLRVPRKLLTAGKPLSLSMTGMAENRNDWFMVFRYPYKEKALITATPFLMNTDKGIKQLLQVYIDHIYPNEKKITLIINQKPIEVAVNEGFNSLEIPLDTVSAPLQLNTVLKLGNKVVYELSVMQNPVIRREVDIIHHSHNDIGYSHFQDDVMKIQQQNIMDALDMIDRTANYPKGSRFVWNEETLWTVEYFFANARGKDKARFIDAVKNNSICLTSFYAGVMTGLCSAPELGWISEYAGILKKKYGFNITSAMLSDIPGISWSTVDALLAGGFKYLSNGPNYIPETPDGGERIGSIYRKLGDKPFYWKSTKSNEKVLLWTAGLGYGAFHGIPFPELGNKMKEKLSIYINKLDSAQYPYDMIQLRYTIKSDNGPLDTNLSNFVRDWNLKYVSPKIIIANVDDMMQRFEQKYGKDLPVLSGDFTPYWEDGAYSTAAEECENRILSDKVEQLQLLANIKPEKTVQPENFIEARKNVVMFHEHTWGAWNSISAPDDAFAINQWNYKKAFIDSTKKYIALIEKVLLPENPSPKTLVVYNTLPYMRSAYVEISLPSNIKGNGVMDENGEFSFIQHLNNGNVCFLAKNVAASGSKKFTFVSSKRKQEMPIDQYSYTIDSLSGALRQLKYLDKEWVNTADFKGLNQALYVKGFDPANRTTSVVKNIEESENGIITKTIKINCNMEGTHQVSYQISFYHGLNYIKLSCTIDKKAIREKEGLHIVFPFDISGPLDRVGISDTFFIPGKSQIPGSNKDFFSVQRWIDISNDDNGATVCSPQAALFELGSITDERPLNKGSRAWKDRISMTSDLFLYAMNNYWNTNFKADQEGKVTFDCYIQLHKRFNLKDARQFGEEMHSPLIPMWE